MGFQLPGWVETIFFSVLTLLPAIQVVLKRIPTASSVRITGIIGKALDLLTFFQPDKNLIGGNHS